MNENHTNTGSGPVNQTTSDRSLAELEQTVEKGKATFLDVGAALVEIRLRKLYKPKGWTEYLKERFGFSRQHAHRIVQAKASADASPVGDKPATEGEARKRLSEKRSNRKRPTNVAEDLDAEEEFERFKSRVSKWAAEFAEDDYLRLLGKVTNYADGILSEADYSDDIVVNQPEADGVAA